MAIAAAVATVATTAAVAAREDWCKVALASSSAGRTRHTSPQSRTACDDAHLSDAGAFWASHPRCRPAIPRARSFVHILHQLLPTLSPLPAVHCLLPPNRVGWRALAGRLAATGSGTSTQQKRAAEGQEERGREGGTRGWGTTGDGPFRALGAASRRGPPRRTAAPKNPACSWHRIGCWVHAQRRLNWISSPQMGGTLARISVGCQCRAPVSAKSPAGGQGRTARLALPPATNAFEESFRPARCWEACRQHKTYGRARRSTIGQKDMSSHRVLHPPSPPSTFHWTPSHPSQVSGDRAAGEQKRGDSEAAVTRAVQIRFTTADTRHERRFTARLHDRVRPCRPPVRFRPSCAG